MISKIEIPVTHHQEVSTIVCDKCSKTLIATPERWHELPEGSYIVRLIKKDFGVSAPENKEFCSEACLIRYYGDKCNEEARKELLVKIQQTNEANGSTYG